MKTDGEYIKRLGAKILDRRKEMNMKRIALSRITNIHVSNILELEKGNRNPHILTLKKIADAMDCNVKDFL
jgi:transcriptional regulator with XRE-family HTH domain